MMHMDHREATKIMARPEVLEPVQHARQSQRKSLGKNLDQIDQAWSSYAPDHWLNGSHSPDG